jgi:hypothetical protein
VAAKPPRLRTALHARRNSAELASGGTPSRIKNASDPPL